jgi:Tol biopolymer transport system component
MNRLLLLAAARSLGRTLPLLVALSIAAIAAGEARAAFPGVNGKIVFETNRDGNAEIYTMNPDGTRRVDLTRNPADDTDPRWSSDGTRIVFASNRTGNYQIYTMKADGSGATRVTQDAADDRRPAWTADGRILFQDRSFPNRAIYRINADGGGLQRLTPASSDNATAAASPRGGRIALSSTRGDGTQRLYTMNADGGAMQLVTPAPPGPETADVEADWSPRGNELLFVRFTFGSSLNSDLYVVQTDGTGLRQLTQTPDRLELQPAWSPDGRKITFFGCSAAGTADQHCAIYTMNADGSGETEISTPRIPYLDTFTGDRIDPFWSSGTGNGTGPTVSEVNGRLQFDVPSSTTNGDAGYATADADSSCRLEGNFDIEADYQLLGWPPLAPDVNGVNVNFGVNFTHTLFVHNADGTTGISTFFPGPLNVFVPFGEMSGALRLVNTGGTLTGYYLSNGDWVPLLSVPFTSLDSFVQLSIFTNDPPFSHPDIVVAFDNFRVNSGIFSCPLWWADNAPNWQPQPS